jgi:hypothetical protein
MWAGYLHQTRKMRMMRDIEVPNISRLSYGTCVPILLELLAQRLDALLFASDPLESRHCI